MTGLVLVLLTLVAASTIVAPIFGARTAGLSRLSTPLCMVVAASTVRRRFCSVAWPSAVLKCDRRDEFGGSRQRVDRNGHRWFGGRTPGARHARRRTSCVGGNLGLGAASGSSSSERSHPGAVAFWIACDTYRRQLDRLPQL